MPWIIDLKARPTWFQGGLFAGHAACILARMKKTRAVDELYYGVDAANVEPFDKCYLSELS